MSIGLKWERELKRIFPELVSIGEDPVVPDFYHPPTDSWIEAKTGNIRWGVRLKEYQIQGFKKFRRPVVYALGLHNFSDAMNRLFQRREADRQRFLDEHMEILKVCFVTQEMMEKLWEKERRVNQKGTIDYCTIKDGCLNNLFFGREFKRFGQTVYPESYYGFSYGDYLFLTGNQETPKFRGIFDTGKDRRLIDYLNRRGIMNAQDRS